MVRGMQTTLPNPPGLSEAIPEPQEVLKAVVLYDTIAAGQRGLSTLARMAGKEDDDIVEIHPRPWKLIFLNDPAGFEDAAHDASSANMIVISTSGMAALPTILKMWLMNVLAERRGGNVAVVALLGLDEKSAATSSRDLHFIKHLTLDAELDFFAPWFDEQHAPHIN